MPLLYNCVICGYPIRTGNGWCSWLGDFRSIYTNSTGAFISGVGRFGVHENGACIVPEDPNQRWDDYKSKPVQWIKPPVKFRSPEYDNFGFAVHDACWCLLQRACQPRQISLERFISVCASLPLSLRLHILSWGHDYGELWTLDDRNFYPWEERLLEQGHSQEIWSFADQNPFSVEELPIILSTRYDRKPGPVPVSKSADRLSTLPWEILESIAIMLPTLEALKLRLVSSAFFPILESRQFWASRFKANEDREFIFEAQDSRHSIDWINLYRLTSNAHGRPGLRNRRRIWDLIKPIDDLTNLYITDCPERLDEDQIQCFQWHAVTGDITTEEAIDGSQFGFSKGCQMFGTHCAHVPTGLSEIRFSVSSVGHTDYISGIRLLTDSGTSTCLGYLCEDKEIRCKVTSFEGFITATGSRGISALKVVKGDGNTSPWIGRPSDMPVTEHLARFNPIAALKVGYDGFKIVSLAVAEYISIPAAVPEDHSLRKTALWYPEVPDSSLCLNEDSCVGMVPQIRAYEPLGWIHFGGPGGSQLKKITGISIDIHQRLLSLEVHYDLDHTVIGELKLGRHEGRREGRREAPLHTKSPDFAIDGAGGEVIERVEVAFNVCSDSLKLVLINSFKITTNHQRIFHCGASDDLDSMQVLKIAPGTTLTGFYAKLNRMFGFQTLGVISEKILNLA